MNLLHTKTGPPKWPCAINSLHSLPTSYPTTMHSVQYYCVHIFIEQKKILWYNFYDNRVAGWYGLHTKRRWCQWNNLISKTLWPLVCLSLHCWPSCVCCVNNYFSKRKSTPKLWPVNGWSFFHICRPTHLVGGCPFSFLVYHYSRFCATKKVI